MAYSNSSSTSHSAFHSGTGYFLLSVIIINAVMAAFATFLNFLVILTFLKNASLRETPSNILILGLAIADFGVGAIAQPTFISNYAVFVSASSDCVSDEIDHKKVWNVFHTIADMFMLVSFLNIIAITVDRFLAVHLHLRYQDFVTTKRYGITLFLIWIFSSGLEISSFMLESKKMFISLLVLYVGFGLINIVFLVKISRVIHRHSVQIQAQQQSVQQSLDMPRYKKTVNTMYYVTSAFLLSFISSLAFGILETFFRDIWRRNELLLDVTCWSLVTINSVLNPIIYCIRVTEIRKAILKLLKSAHHNE